MNNAIKRRKLCVVINSRANYGRIKSVLKAAREHPALDVQIIIGASALLHRFGSVIDVIRNDGFEPSATVHSIVEGETPTTMAKSTGLAIIELATQFENLKPDVVVTVADRFETIATAIAASYMNIALAHTQGGEITGSIDESVRHAVTKLAHLHFPATKLASEYLVRMGRIQIRSTSQAALQSMRLHRLICHCLTTCLKNIGESARLSSFPSRILLYSSIR